MLESFILMMFLSIEHGQIGDFWRVKQVPYLAELIELGERA